MSPTKRFIFAAITAVIVAGGYGFLDTWRGAQWVVSPQQIAQARAEGKAGVESRPGTVTVRPIRKEDAGLLPFKWLGIGTGVGLVVFFAGRKRENV